MTNTGAASVHFGVYPNAYRNDGPWPFDVNTTNSATVAFSTATTAGKYDFSCYGPNGFQRRFAGNITNDFQKIEAVSILDPVSGGIKIELDNASSSSVTLVVTNGYAGNSVSYPLAAHSTNVINVGSETNNGFYDVNVTASTDSLFVRKFLGRVETYAPPVIAGGKLLGNGTFQISFGGPAAQPYRILTATNLANAASWIVVGSGTFGSSPGIYTDTNVVDRAVRFFRLVSP
jgi:phospholipase C